MDIQRNTFTQNMMAKFPSWMKMAKDPNSIGAQFLDAFGLTLEGFKNELDETIENFYIETAHTDVIDLLYKIPLATVRVSDMDEGDGTENTVQDVMIQLHDGGPEMALGATSLRHFYSRQSQLPMYYIDRDSGYLYLRVDFDSIEDIQHPFEAVLINNNPHYDIEIHHVWNIFDEFGLLLGLKRLKWERNEAYKSRILDVFENPGGVTPEGLKSGIARELGLNKEEVVISDFQDQAYGSELVHSDGKPTEKLVRYAKELNNQLKFTWDNFNLGEAYWFSVEQDNLGIHYLPHIWDVDLGLFSREEFQSGVGDVDAGDLKVTGPKTESSTREFKAYVSLIGYFEEVEEFFPEIAFQYKIYARGKTLEDTYEEESFRYTIEAAEVFEQDWRLIAYQDFPYTMRTEFDNKNNFFDTPDRERMQFGLSNDFLHTQTDQIMRLGIELSTQDVEQSNWIKELEVIWEDSAGNDNTYSFETQDDFLLPRTNASGEPETALAFSDVSFNDEDGLGLGYGAFHKDIDTTVEWQQGSWETNSIIIKEGTVSLNLERMAGLMN